MEEFDRRMIVDSKCQGSLLIANLVASTPIPPEVIAGFESVLGRPITGGSNQLTESEVQAVLEFLIEHETVLLKPGCLIDLKRHLQVSSWRIHERITATDSIIGWAFGTQPHVTTMLCFANREEFEFVRDVFDSLKICKLNEKHLKQRREKV